MFISSKYYIRLEVHVTIVRRWQLDKLCKLVECPVLTMPYKKEDKNNDEETKATSEDLGTNAGKWQIVVSRYTNLLRKLQVNVAAPLLKLEKLMGEQRKSFSSIPEKTFETT